MLSLDEKQNNIISLFSKLNDWELRYKKVIDLGKAMPEISEKYKTEDNIVRGCQSQVWLAAELKDKKIYYYADSDAMIVRGLVSLLVDFYSGHGPDEILTTQPEFISKLGFDSNLSRSRTNGLLAMIKQIKFYAMAFKTQL